MNNKPFKLIKRNLSFVYIILIFFAILWIGMAFFLSFIEFKTGASFNPGFVMIPFGCCFLAFAIYLFIKNKEAVQRYKLCSEQGKKGIATVLCASSVYNSSSNGSGTYSFEVTIEYRADDGNIYRSILYVDKNDLNYLQANMEVPALIYDKYAIIDFNAVTQEKAFESDFRRTVKEEVTYCKLCGHKNFLDAEYCSDCGCKLNDVANTSMDDFAKPLDENNNDFDNDDFFENLKKDDKYL